MNEFIALVEKLPPLVEKCQQLARVISAEHSEQLACTRQFRSNGRARVRLRTGIHDIKRPQQFVDFSLRVRKVQRDVAKGPDEVSFKRGSHDSQAPNGADERPRSGASARSNSRAQRAPLALYPSRSAPSLC